jgi:tetratricopeptide (TPR) repeat protein
MSIDEKLQQGISAARAGQRREARDLLREVVAIDPRNVLAWMWLSGLLDGLDERIAACERALALDPGNARMQAYREQLLAKLPQPAQVAGQDPAGETGAGPGDDVDADLDEKVRACQAALAANPQDARARQELQRLQYLAGHPFELGIHYEEQGEPARAMRSYQRAFALAVTRQDKDAVYQRIHQLENRQKEKIVHIPPAISVARLTAGPPLLYLGLLLLQVGINPLAEPALLLWVGLLWVALGAFLAAMAAVHSYHPLWQQVFKDAGSGRSSRARLAMGAIGWTMILLPHLILFFDALVRLNVFEQQLTW